MKKKLLLLSTVLIGVQAMAQQAVTNKGNLQIFSGGSVGVFGNFNNTSTGALVNNGTLYAKAGITNDQSSMTAGTGSLQLNGTASQTIGGTASFKTYNLTTANSFGIVLNANLSVSGTHTFSSGIVTPAASNFLVYEAGSSYTGNSDSRHVNGWVKKFGNTDFVFPVGSATIERPVSLVNLTTGSEFNARYQAPTPNTSQMQGPLVNMDENEYWAITKVSGGAAAVTMNWNNSKVAFPNWQLSMIRAAQYNGSQWIDQGGTASGNTSTTGTITSSALSSFNLFTFGSKDFILPLQVLRFEARRMVGYTQLHWQTRQEQAVRHFVVERSDNGTQFYNIGQTPARNSGRDENYFSEDHAAIKGKAWYRLRSVDNNGVEKLSPIVRVTDAASNTVFLVANPVHDRLLLNSFLQADAVFRYQVRALDGRLVQEGITLLQRSGVTTISLNASVASGVYTLHLYDGKQTFAFKFQAH